MTTESSKLKKLRRFKLISFGNAFINNGEYTGTRAAQAALKAFNRQARIINSGTMTDIEFTIQELTGRQKIYKYLGTRIDNHHIISRGGTEYGIRYTTFIRQQK